MPVTFPAHAAAVLPLLRWRGLHATALIVGTTAPDLGYLGEIGTFTHRPLGLFLFCVPAGVVAVAYVEGLVLPTLRRALPDAFGVNWARVLVSDGPPSSLRSWRVVALSVFLGALTHQVWDGFTHGTLFPGALYKDIRLGFEPFSMTLPRWGQHLSTLIGTAAVLEYARRRYRRLPPVAAGSARELGGLVAVSVLGVALGLLWKLQLPLRGGNVYTQVWRLFWPSATLALLFFSLAAYRLHRGRQRSSRRADVTR